jgi:hypothetical protein
VSSTLSPEDSKVIQPAITRAQELNKKLQEIGMQEFFKQKQM